MNDRCSEELKDGGVSFYVGLFTAFSIVVGCFASLVGDNKIPFTSLRFGRGRGAGSVYLQKGYYLDC